MVFPRMWGRKGRQYQGNRLLPRGRLNQDWCTSEFFLDGKSREFFDMKKKVSKTISENSTYHLKGLEVHDVPAGVGWRRFTPPLHAPSALQEFSGIPYFQSLSRVLRHSLFPVSVWKHMFRKNQRLRNTHFMIMYRRPF